MLNVLARLTAVASLLVGVSAQAQTTVNSTTSSGSNSESVSGSISGAASLSDQQQGQTQGQSLAAQQGNTQNITFNTPAQPKKVTIENQANQNVPLAAAVSFSSDFCGGTASGGVSTSLGFSVGGSKVVMDRNCQSLRRAEKFSIIAATAHNMGYKEWGAKLLSMSIWEMCQSEMNAGRALGEAIPSTANACHKLGLYGDQPFPPAPAAAMPGLVQASVVTATQREDAAKVASPK